MIAGAMIGFNRGVRGHAAGLRTTILVGLAASVAMIQANILLSIDGKTTGSFAVMDLMRLTPGNSYRRRLHRRRSYLETRRSCDRRDHSGDALDDDGDRALSWWRPNWARNDGDKADHSYFVGAQVA